MTFAGPPVGFSFNLAEKGKGTKYGGSVTSDGRNIYYYADDGFYKFDGVNSINIGSDKVNTFFADNINTTQLVTLTAAFDPIHRIIIWSYTSSAESTSIHDRSIVYNINDNRWTEFNVGFSFIFNGLTQGLTLEQLGDLFPNLDVDVPETLDSRRWTGGVPALIGFDSNNQLGLFNGDRLDAVIETTESRINDQGRSLVTNILPVVDTNQARIVVLHRSLQGDVLASEPAVLTNNVTGEADMVVDDRYFKVQLLLNDNSWSKAQGIRFRSVPTGVI